MILFGYATYADIEGVILTRKRKSKRKVLGSRIRIRMINIISIFGIVVQNENRIY